MWFAMAHPYDHVAALNPRYLLSQIMPMSACLGLMLAELESGTGVKRAAASFLGRAVAWGTLGLVLIIGFMLVYERFGRW
jgi:hypothetical protein